MRIVLNHGDETIEIREGRESDAAAIVELFRNETTRTLEASRIAREVSEYPSSIATQGKTLIGFAYGVSFAPDVLELKNMMVMGKWRNKRIGAALLKAFETLAGAEYRGIILVNSRLYPTKGKKRMATDFYQRAGYEPVLQTEDTGIFAKLLTEKPT